MNYSSLNVLVDTATLIRLTIEGHVHVDQIDLATTNKSGIQETSHTYSLMLLMDCTYMQIITSI